MNRLRAASVALVVLLSFLSPVAAAPAPIRVGILPFDVVSVDSAGADASAALAKLVRPSSFADERPPVTGTTEAQTRSGSSAS